MKEPKFQRRHYKQIAAVLRKVAADWGRDAPHWSVIKTEMGHMLSVDNPRFDVGRFEEACEP